MISLSLLLSFLALISRGALSAPLSLEQALELARQNRPALGASRAELQAAQARVSQARAALLPQARASASWQTSAQAETWATSASAEQLLWGFGSGLRGLQAANSSAQAAEQDLSDSVLATDYLVRESFFGALAASELAQVAQESLENAEVHYKQVSAFIEVQSRPEIDRAQARADLANARVEQIRATADQALALAALARAIGLESATEIQPSVESLAAIPGEDGPLETLAAEALERRPDLRAARARVQALRASHKATRVGALPELGAQVGSSASATTLSGLEPAWYAGLGLQWSFLQGGAVLARTREAQASITVYESHLLDAVAQVRLEVEQAWRRVGSNREALLAANDALEAARLRLELAQGRYTEGVGNAVEESDARLDFTRARSQQVRTELDLALARAGLLYALGRERP